MSPSHHLKTETDQFSETLCFLVIKFLHDGKVHKTNDSILHTILRTLRIIRSGAYILTVGCIYITNIWYHEEYREASKVEQADKVQI
jgi:hypothetical protein